MELKLGQKLAYWLVFLLCYSSSALPLISALVIVSGQSLLILPSLFPFPSSFRLDKSVAKVLPFLQQLNPISSQQTRFLRESATAFLSCRIHFSNTGIGGGRRWQNKKAAYCCPALGFPAKSWWLSLCRSMRILRVWSIKEDFQSRQGATRKKLLSALIKGTEIGVTVQWKLKDDYGFIISMSMIFIFTLNELPLQVQNQNLVQEAGRDWAAKWLISSCLQWVPQFYLEISLHIY